MSHIDTLKVYQEYRAAGLNDQQAKDYTNILESSFMTEINSWLKEVKSEFASNTLQSILIIVFIGVSAGVFGILWKLSVDMESIKVELKSQGVQIQQLSMRDN